MAATSPMVVKTVLVADDTEFVRERFRTAIESAGHRALVARSRAEVLALIARDTPHVDLVILDLRLADGRGVELLRAVRQQGDHPVIIFSGTIASTSEVRQLTDLGISGYINEYTGTQHIVPALAPHLFPNEHNRRSSPRVTLGVSVSYRVGSTISSGLSLNISTGGIAVRSTNPHAVDRVVKLRFRLPKGTHDIEAEARVAWSDTRLGMGLQFTRIDPSDQALVETFVTSHFFSNRKA